MVFITIIIIIGIVLRKKSAIAVGNDVQLFVAWRSFGVLEQPLPPGKRDSIRVRTMVDNF